MKQTVNAHISGMVFHIETDAYDRLQTYLKTIERYFDHSDGKDEIISDIESRIAELLKERLDESREVVTHKDVEEVIAIMGQPEDYLTGDGANYEQAHTNEGYATGSSTDQSGPKRLFRDPDNKVLGGVCSGIGAYFGIDPVWLRLMFLAAFLIWGTGLLFYIVLWVVIPEARTAAEKLQMKGRPVTAENIAKMVQDELGRVKKKIDDININDVPETGKHFFGRIIKVIGDIVNFVLTTVFMILKFGFKVIGIFLLIALFLGLLTLVWSGMHFVPFTGWDADNPSLHHFNYLLSLIISEPWIRYALIVGALLIIIVPILFIVTALLKFIFNIRVGMKYAFLAGGSLWVISILAVITSSFLTATHFQNYEEVRQFEQMDATNKTLKVRCENLEGTRNPIDLIHDHDDFHLMVNEDTLEYANSEFGIYCSQNECNLTGIPEVRIVRSKDEYVHVETIKIARGKNNQEAGKMARNISYYTTYFEDSLLMLDPLFEVDPLEIYRGQEVIVLIQIPEGQMIEIDPSMQFILTHAENEENMFESDMPGRVWIMGKHSLELMDRDDRSANLSYPGDGSEEENKLILFVNWPIDLSSYQFNFI